MKSFEVVLKVANSMGLTVVRYTQATGMVAALDQARKYLTAEGDKLSEIVSIKDQGEAI